MNIRRRIENLEKSVVPTVIPEIEFYTPEERKIAIFCLIEEKPFPPDLQVVGG